MSNFTDFISGGGGSLPVNIALTKSQTWVPPVDGTICIHVIGAGGGGGANISSYSGGGAGGYCKKSSLAVTTSGSFTVVIGAGGSGGLPGDGTAGGNTTVAGTGLSSTLTANGGAGGTTSNSVAGGAASNGDVNNAGQNSSIYGGGGIRVNGGSAYTGNFTGGTCDSLGDPSLSGYGYLAGGLGGKYIGYGSGDSNGGFLSGGGTTHWSANAEVSGGSGGIGGGGGACKNDFSGNFANGGQGGNGIVIIQYLPA